MVPAETQSSTVVANNNILGPVESRCRDMHKVKRKETVFSISREYFREKFTIGRDRFYNVLRSNSLMLRRTRYRPRTTDSRHGYRLYRDLVNTSPKYTPLPDGRVVNRMPTIPIVRNVPNRSRNAWWYSLRIRMTM